MRAIATLIALILGASLAFASDARIDYGPIKAAPKAKAAAKSKAKAAAKRTAKPEPAKAEKKAAAKDQKAKAQPEKTQPDKAEAAKAAPAKPEPAKPDPKAKTAKGKPDPVTTGAVAAAAKPGGIAETYAALSHTARAALQSDLSWSGDYGGPLDGVFSDRLADAVKAYQKRHKSKITGVLSAQEREALSAAVRPRQEDVGWLLVEDPVTGARVGVPTKLATVTARAPSGTRWSSEQGQLQIETFRIDTGAELDALFEQHKKETARRKIRFSAMRDDYFVVSGMQGLKKFHTRIYARNGDVRGLSILYDQAMEGTVDPMIVAMASAFQPYARFTVASVAGEAQRKVEYGTAIAASADGHFIAARAIVDRCQVIAIAGLGNAERLFEDKDAGLALLRVYGARDLKPIGIAQTGAPPSGADVTLVGVADPQSQGGRNVVSAVAARLGGGANALVLHGAPAQGFSGAAAVDAKGRFLGVVVQRPAVVAGPAQPPQTALIPAERVRHALAANNVAAATAHAGLDAVKNAARRVICVRK
ncbi:MAG: peptidoglycan-binding protein [Alphaproteobacteria bacterium]|nr:peptidoglycan-binding protein [Alphaproteobacteria bacterium]